MLVLLFQITHTHTCYNYLVNRALDFQSRETEFKSTVLLKVNSVFHLSEVHQMRTRKSWGFSGKY